MISTTQLLKGGGTYCMNFSSSSLVALMGGPDSFFFLSPPLKPKYPPKNVVPRVAIASYMYCIPAVSERPFKLQYGVL